MVIGAIIELTYIDYNAHKTILALPKLKTSAKSVQTTAEVSRKYYVLIDLSTRTH